MRHIFKVKNFIAAAILLLALVGLRTVAEAAEARVNLVFENGTVLIYAGKEAGFQPGQELTVVRSGQTTGTLEVVSVTSNYVQAKIITGLGVVVENDLVVSEGGATPQLQTGTQSGVKTIETSEALAETGADSGKSDEAEDEKASSSKKKSSSKKSSSRKSSSRSSRSSSSKSSDSDDDEGSAKKSSRSRKSRSSKSSESDDSGDEEKGEKEQIQPVVLKKSPTTAFTSGISSWKRTFRARATSSIRPPWWAWITGSRKRKT
ncbi:hypothetical protein ACFLQK_00645 [bacterium]